MSGWAFIPDEGATSDVPDADYLHYGFWLKRTADADGVTGTTRSRPSSRIFDSAERPGHEKSRAARPTKAARLVYGWVAPGRQPRNGHLRPLQREVSEAHFAADKG